MKPIALVFAVIGALSIDLFPHPFHRHCRACGPVATGSFVGSNFSGYADPGCGGAVAAFVPSYQQPLFVSQFSGYSSVGQPLVIVNNNRRFFGGGNRVNVNAPGVHVRVR